MHFQNARIHVMTEICKIMFIKYKRKRKTEGV